MFKTTSTLAQTSVPVADSPTIEIDPDEVPGVEVVPAEEPPAEPDAQGAVEEALDDFVPETGMESVDGAVNTLTDAVGGMVDGLIGMLPQLVIALVVLLATALLVKIADGIACRLMSRARVKESLRDLFRIFVRTAMWFFGLMTAAIIVFPGFGVGNLIATAGLASIAIGFAFQDIFANFFAGILILWRFPFENGDFIEVDGLMGQVEDVEIRSTSIRTPGGELVIVPNSTIFQNKVNILTNRPQRLIELSVGIAYGEDVAQGRQVILDAVKSCASVRDTAPPEVLATAFGASSIDFDVLWWADSTPIAIRRSRDEVVQAIKSALDNAGIEIPYPHRTLTFSPNEPAIIHAVAGRGGGTNGDAEAGQD